MRRRTIDRSAAALVFLLAGCGESADGPRQPTVRGADAAVDGAAPSAPDGQPADDAAPVDETDAAPGEDAAAPAPDATPPPTREGWRLVWHDEFDAAGDTPPDPTRWVHDVGGHGWGNEQLEFDTDRIENAAHDGAGHLAITARQESFGGRDYTSARIKTQGLFARRYGRFEARIRQPEGAGIWPAFWLLGENIGEVGWPQCGEIDIMEFRGQATGESTGALHGPGYAAGASRNGAYASPTPLSDDFHVYAVEWHADAIEWFVDDTRFLRVLPQNLPAGAPWVFDQPFFIILNLAIGGTFVGPPDRSTVFPQQLLVDYVRVYEAAE